MSIFRKTAGRLGRVFGAALLAGAVLAGPTGAQSPEKPKLLIGTTYCFQVRCPDGSESPEERVEQVHHVFARYLGSGKGTFTLQKSGKAPNTRVMIRLNGDPVITVTLDDAKATRFLSADDLAPVWKAALEKAFNETSAAP